MISNIIETQVAEKLLAKNIRPSVQRMAVYGYLLTHPTHPTVDTIYTDLTPKIPTLSKTTVYNTLKYLVENKLVQTVTIEDGELRYDADMKNHLHFKCTSCGMVYDIFEEIAVPSHIIPTDFSIEKIQTNFWGRCKNCKEA